MVGLTGDDRMKGGSWDGEYVSIGATVESMASLVSVLSFCPSDGLFSSSESSKVIGGGSVGVGGGIFLDNVLFRCFGFVTWLLRSVFSLND